MQRPKIIDIGENDSFHFERHKFIRKTAIGIRCLKKSPKDKGFYSASIYVSGRWIYFLEIKLSYIPKKFKK